MRGRGLAALAPTGSGARRRAARFADAHALARQCRWGRASERGAPPVRLRAAAAQSRLSLRRDTGRFALFLAGRLVTRRSCRRGAQGRTSAKDMGRGLAAATRVWKPRIDCGGGYRRPAVLLAGQLRRCRPSGGGGPAHWQRLTGAHRPPAAASTPCSVMLLVRAATETAAEARGRHQQNILCECPLVGTARFGRPDRALGSEASAG